MVIDPQDPPHRRRDVLGFETGRLGGDDTGQLDLRVADGEPDALALQGFGEREATIHLFGDAFVSSLGAASTFATGIGMSGGASTPPSSVVSSGLVSRSDKSSTEPAPGAGVDGFDCVQRGPGRSSFVSAFQGFPLGKALGMRHDVPLRRDSREKRRVPTLGWSRTHSAWRSDSVAPAFSFLTIGRHDPPTGLVGGSQKTKLGSRCVPASFGRGGGARWSLLRRSADEGGHEVRRVYLLAIGLSFASWSLEKPRSIRTAAASKSARATSRCTASRTATW